MCMGSGGVPKATEPQPMEQQLDASAQYGNEAERKRRRQANTFMSATSGVMGPANLGKTSLGA